MDGQENFAAAAAAVDSQPAEVSGAEKPKKDSKGIWKRVGIGFLKAMYFLRSIPVVVVIALIASGLATANLANLPEVMFVGTYELTRRMAVLAPATATALCLAMVLLSRRPVYPIVISIFTLGVPILLKYIGPYLG